MRSSQSKPPLVAIVGTTGVGKSQLGVELALALQDHLSVGYTSGEVINTDSMQVYAGLDVITNKASSEEMRGVKHHLMGFLPPGQEFRVGQFQKEAQEKTSELFARHALPIAVGGTAYYLQNLILPNQLVADVPAERPGSVAPSSNATLDDIAQFPDSLRDAIMRLPAELLELFLVLPQLPPTSTPDAFPPSFPTDSLPETLRTPEAFNPALHQLLSLVDPQSAKRWHWRDIRKVRRALEIVWEGRRWADVLEAQRMKQKNGDGARFRTLIFWIYANNDALHPRLDNRVDRMLELGLLDEIQELWRIAQADPAGEVDFSRGIYQAIGYKEFAAYLSEGGATASLESAQSDSGFQSGLEAMKVSTRQYAKRQVKWIKGKLLPAIHKLDDPSDVLVYLLDATDLAVWDETVRQPAIDLLIKFLREEPMPEPSSLSSLAAEQLGSAAANKDNKTLRTCPACTAEDSKPFLIEERQWDAHRRSKAHQRMQRIRDGTQRDPAKLKAEAEARRRATREQEALREDS